jgi:hypothetical protein
MYNLSIGLFFKNDHHYLLEWVEYYKLIGVEHFYMACNDDNPSLSYNILRKYIDSKIMTFTHIKGGPAVVKQLEAHEWFLSINKTKWLIVVDLDEFLFSVKGHNMLDILDNYEHYGGVTANWMNYGSSGLYARPDFALESFVYRGHESFHNNILYKGIIQPKKVLAPINPHSFQMKEGEYMVDELGRRIIGGSVSNYSVPITWKILRINHYRVKSWTDFQEKCSRWKDGGHPEFVAFGCDGYFKISDKNDVYDNILHKYVPAIKRALANKLSS